MFLKRKKNALTYVELVMVLTIIGVIAAMTIPGLKKHSQRTEMGNLAKKSYMQLEDAIDNSILINGPIRNWNFSSNETFFNTYIVPSFKVLVRESSTSVVTNDRARYSVAECNGKFCHIHVDVNAGGPPNVTGKDIFEFQVNRIDNGGNNRAETMQPASFGGADLLKANDWKFTDELWDRKWVATP